MIIQQTLRTDRAFHALADPTRRKILEHLGRQERSVMELVEQFTISQPAITKHLNVLEGAGLISRRKAGRQRMCRAEPAGMSSAAAWIATWTGYWNNRLDELEKFLATHQHSRS
jgi:DNA-binding transcriptional ArsR family regulator